MTSVAADAAPAAADGTAPWTRTQAVALAVVTAGALALRLFRIEAWSWNDAEAATWRAVTQAWSGPGGLLSTVEALAPLPWLVLRTLLAAGMPDGEGWMRLPFAFAGVLAVPLLALAARRHLGANGALLAAALLAVHPLHVAASQTAAPPVAALTIVLLAAALATWSVRAAWAALAAATLTAPVAWGMLAVPLLRRAPAGAVRAVAVAAAIGAVCTVGELTLPLALLATLGLAVPGAFATLPAAAAAVPLAVAALLTAWQPVAAAAAALLALPGCLVLAVRGILFAHAAVAPRLRGSRTAVALGAGLPGAVLGVWLMTETALLLAIYGGGRTPWRFAAGVVWAASATPGDLAVGAAAGAAPLTCYLLPNHWRDGASGGSGRTVVALDLARPVEALQALATRSETHTLLALREDEVERLETDAAANAALRAFALVRVVATPVPRGLGSVHVYHVVR